MGFEPRGWGHELPVAALLAPSRLLLVLIVMSICVCGCGRGFRRPGCLLLRVLGLGGYEPVLAGSAGSFYLKLNNFFLEYVIIRSAYSPMSVVRCHSTIFFGIFGHGPILSANNDPPGPSPT